MNKKNFLAPPSHDCGFKELFQKLMQYGAGRDIDQDGFPAGPWTPKLLCEAISRFDDKGVDVRTTQLWFQENSTLPSHANIRWLARVFGCGNPDETLKWQVALVKAKSISIANRRKKLEELTTE